MSPSLRDERGYSQGFKPSPSLEIRTRRRVDYMISILGQEAFSRILELGCGTGDISYQLAKRTRALVTGLDLSEKFISKARKDYNCENLNFIAGDFGSEELDLSRTPFDCVLGNGILHHLYYNLQPSLLKIRSLLKPGAKIIFLEPNLFNPYCFFAFKVPALRRYLHLEPTEMAFSKRFIQKELQKAGFHSIDIKYKDFLIPGTPPSLISPLCLLGEVLERLPVAKALSQSLFISARRD